MKKLPILLVTTFLIIINGYSLTDNDTYFDGIATHYFDANVTDPACGFPWPGEDAYYCALNSYRLHLNGDSAVGCGAYIQVLYKDKEILCNVIDECPYPVSDSSLGCWNTEHLDLSKSAFTALDDLNIGVLAIKWKIVPFELSGAIEYHYHDSASQYWLALQIRNHSQAIKSLEIKKSGEWIKLTRTPWNYFVFDGNAGNAPYSFRVTSIGGEVLEDNDVEFLGGGDFNGGDNFSVTKLIKPSFLSQNNIYKNKKLSVFKIIGEDFYLSNIEIEKIKSVELYDLQGKRIKEFKPALQLPLSETKSLRIVKLIYK